MMRWLVVVAAVVAAVAGIGEEIPEVSQWRSMAKGLEVPTSARQDASCLASEVARLSVPAPLPERMGDIPDGVNIYWPPGATCAFGTPYYVTFIKKNPKRLLVFLTGGGACFNYASCCNEDTFTYNPVSGTPEYMAAASCESDLLTQIQMIGTVQQWSRDDKGIFSLTDENPLSDYSMLVLPTCNGDATLSNAVSEYSAGPGGPSCTINHMGSGNIEIGLDWIFGLVGHNVKKFAMASFSGGTPAADAHMARALQKLEDIRGVDNSITYTLLKDSFFGMGIIPPEWKIDTTGILPTVFSGDTPNFKGFIPSPFEDLAVAVLQSPIEGLQFTQAIAKAVRAYYADRLKVVEASFLIDRTQMFFAGISAQLLLGTENCTFDPPLDCPTTYTTSVYPVIIGNSIDACSYTGVILDEEGHGMLGLDIENIESNAVIRAGVARTNNVLQVVRNAILRKCRKPRSCRASSDCDS